MSKTPIPVSAKVFEGLEAVRRSGITNMFDRPRVVELAELMGYEETAEWVREHREQYAQVLFNGVAVLDEQTGGA